MQSVSGLPRKPVLIGTPERSAPYHPGPPRHTRLLTDSQGGAYMIPKLSTRSPYGTAILAEMAIHMHTIGTHVMAAHRHRETNTWAEIQGKS